LAAGGKEGPWPSWIFIDGTDKVEKGLMMIFFGLVFTVTVLPLEIFLPTPMIHSFPA